MRDKNTNGTGGISFLELIRLRKMRNIRLRTTSSAGTLFSSGPAVKLLYGLISLGLYLERL